MNDIVITAQRVKIEIFTFIFCFFIAFSINLYAIIRYNTSFVELFTSIGYILVTAIVLYIFWSLLRIVGYGIKVLFLKKKK
jgi:uncharacterized membrane protein